MSDVADVLRQRNIALREENAILRKCNNYKHSLSSREEIWNLIKESGCDIISLLKIYYLVMNGMDKLRIVIECSAKACKAMNIAIVWKIKFSYLVWLKGKGEEK